MTILTALKKRLGAFGRREDGTVMVEVVMTLPLLFLALMATHEFFEVHRYNSARDKATYTVSDMLSRELAPVDDTYIDNTMTLFNEIANDSGANQIRVSVVKYDIDDDEYSIVWSEVRGTGDMIALTTAEVMNDHDTLPTMADGEEVILVESESVYQAWFDVGLRNNLKIETRVITSPRFVPQVVWES